MNSKSIVSILSEISVFEYCIKLCSLITLMVFSGLCYSSSDTLSPDSIEHYFSFDADDGIQSTPGTSFGKLLGASVISGAGKAGAGLVLSGKSDVLTVSGINLDGLTEFSISAWVKPTDFTGPSAEGRVIAKSTGVEEAQHNWMLGLGGDGTAIRFRVKTSVNGTATLSTLQGQIDKNKWSHIAAVYTGQRMEIYVDGVLSASKGKTGRVIDSEAINASIGNQSPNLEHRAFTGVIDDLVVFSDALSGDILKSIAASEIDIDPKVHSESVPKEIVAYGDLLIPVGDVASTPWGPSLTLTGADTNGNKAPIVFGWNGYSVSTSRNRLQIDYDATSNTAEEIYLVFDEPASSITLHLGYFETAEWRGLPETGAWVAYDASGEKLAEGILNAQQPIDGSFPNVTARVKSFGINVNEVSVLKVYPTGYGSGQGAKILGNNSDFNIQGLDYTSGTSKVSLRGAKATINQTVTSSVVTAKEIIGEIETVTEKEAVFDANFDTSPTQELISSTPESAAGWPANYDNNVPLGNIFYGQYQVGFHTGNARIALQSARRFRAERGGYINAVSYNNRVFSNANIASRCVPSAPDSTACKCLDAGLDQYTCGYTASNSYSVGNGGSIVIEVRTDNDGVPSDTVLGETAIPFVPMHNVSNATPVLELAQPVKLIAGEIYHLVWVNKNPPKSCAFSHVALSKAGACPKNQGAIGLNGMYLTKVVSPNGGVDPFRGNSGANFHRMSTNKEWTEETDNLSWYEVRYNDGVWIGDTYAAYKATNDGQESIGGANVARQVFTVEDGTKTVDGLWLHFGHTNGGKSDGSPITVKLKDSNQNVLTTGTISASQECINSMASSNTLHDRYCREWGYSEFTEEAALIEGNEYSLEVSAGQNSGVVISSYFPLNYGGFKFQSRGRWANAAAEISRNSGRTWQAFDSNIRRNMGLLFTISGMPRSLP